MEAKGKIIAVLPLQSGVSKSGETWKSQSFVVFNEESQRNVCFEIFGEKRINENPFNVNDVVTVLFNIESREFNGRWFTSARAWKVTVEEPAAETDTPAPTPEETSFEEAVESDELPF